MNLHSINRFHPATGEEIIFLLQKRVYNLAQAVTYAGSLGYNCKAVAANKNFFVARIRESDAKAA